jgi:hypothetical protein
MAAKKVDKAAKLIPEPDVVVLEKRAAWEAMVTHFGAEDAKTMPMPLDELPDTRKERCDPSDLR